MPTRFPAVLVVACIWNSASAQEASLQATADTWVNIDLDSRANDNYGAHSYLKVGPSRGGGGLPYGTPDAMRTLIRFDLSSFNQPVAQAILELTITGFGQMGTPRVHHLDIHRVLDSGSLTPWIEGNGDAGPPPLYPGAVDVDTADGVAWLGAGDGGDLNNQSQPSFDPTVVATAVVDEPGGAMPGDTVSWDITSLVNAWITGTPNYGLVIRDVTNNGTYHVIVFTSRNADLYDYTENRQFPVIEPGPRLKIWATISVEQESWAKIKAQYR